MGNLIACLLARFIVCRRYVTAAAAEAENRLMRQLLQGRAA